MSVQDQTPIHTFAFLHWYDETIQFTFNFVAKTSGQIPNSTHYGAFDVFIGSVVFFAYTYTAKDHLSFQASLPFSPVSGAILKIHKNTDLIALIEQIFYMLSLLINYIEFSEYIKFIEKKVFTYYQIYDIIGGYQKR